MIFFFFLETLGAPQKKAAILLLSWSKMSWVLFLDFHFGLVAQVSCLKLIYSQISGYSVKEASIFFYLVSALYITFSRSKVVGFVVVIFTFSLLTQIPCLKHFYCRRSWCSAKEATIYIEHPKKWPESS